MFCYFYFHRLLSWYYEAPSGVIGDLNHALLFPT
jgi:hypothetical protein